MKARELLIEKGLRFGKREMMKALQDSELFTYGFEAEFIIDVDEMENEPEIRRTKLTHIDDLRDLVDAAELTHSEQLQLDRQFDDWKADKAGELADEEFEDQEIDTDEWQDVYNDKYESLKEQNYIDEEGVEEILKELNPEKEWEIVDNKQIQVKLYPQLEGDESIDFLAEFVSNNFPHKVEAEGSHLDKFNLTWDSSVKPDDGKEDDKGVELVSPVFDDYQEFQDAIDDAFSMIRRIGYTNNTSGFHVNIGPKYKSMTIDVLKLSLLVGDEYVARMFGREMNSYAETVQRHMKQNLHNLDLDPTSSWSEVLQSVEKILGDDEKYKAVNVGKLKNQGYLEFRITGGENYHSHLDRIINTVLRYVYVLTVAANPNKGRKEYMNELGRLAVDLRPSYSGKFNRDKYRQIVNIFRNAGLSPQDYEGYRMGSEQTHGQKIDKIVRVILVLANAGNQQIPKGMRYWVTKEIERLGIKKEDVSNYIIGLMRQSISSLNEDRVYSVLSQLNFPTETTS